MNVGWIGLGRLGRPIAEEIAKTHFVAWNDQDEGLPKSKVLYADLIFVAVQTPHDSEFDGTHLLTDRRADFDYSYLRAAVSELADAGRRRPPLVIVSTVLPGTIEREILPLWDGPVVYNPFFIAMGEEVEDFLSPEFVLCGYEGDRFPLEIVDLYRSLGVIGNGAAQLITTGYCEAELTKLAYNTFIGLKIVFANQIGELCARLGCDSDTVLHVLHHARKRLISTKYLSAGMGDGGPCHPRDNIAMSWLARELGMSFDLFGAIMEAREAHMDWLATMIYHAALGVNFPGSIVGQARGATLLGKSYKPDTDLTDGSAALLLARILDERGISYTHEQ